MKHPITALFLCLSFFSVGVFAFGDDITWKPVTQAELDMKQPLVEPDADAEAIFWEVRLDDKDRKKLYYEHYVRVKIFTERGRETYSKIDIKHLEDTKVENIAARVIKADGTIILVSPSQIFERDIFKSRRLKIKSKSFALPGIEPGVIVEYQYRERFKGDNLSGERLHFQRDLPIQRMTYWIRPYKDASIQPTFFNIPDSDLEWDPQDKEFLVKTLTNVPAFKEEPFMPPEDEVKPWIFLNYAGFFQSWFIFGSSSGRGFDAWTEPDKTIDRKAAEITSGARNDGEKVRRIFDFVRTGIRNVSYDGTLSDGSYKQAKKTSDTLKRGFGTGFEINMLFASLLRGAGKTPALVITPDRSDLFFDPNKSPVHPSFLHYAAISVSIDEKREFFDPGTPYLPFGRLVWYEENVYGMVANSTGYRWIGIGMAKAEESAAKRKGKFVLNADGGLSGTVEKEFTGYQAIEIRRRIYSDDDNKRITDLKESIVSAFTTAEVSDLEYRNFDALDLPLIHAYKISIPDYAQKTGSRMFFMPGVFESNSKAVFSAAERKHPLYFRFPWSELDEIEIKLPTEFAIENFSYPPNVVERSGIGALRYTLDYNIESHTITYKRDFFFGGDKKILFPAGSYEALKTLFDNFHKSDTHTVALKRKEQ